MYRILKALKRMKPQKIQTEISVIKIEETKVPLKVPSNRNEDSKPEVFLTAKELESRIKNTTIRAEIFDERERIRNERYYKNR